MTFWQCSTENPQVEKVVSGKSAQSCAHFYASMMIKVYLRKKKQENHSNDKSINIFLSTLDLLQLSSFLKSKVFFF